ncbi:unnamed protein product [Blepharisma stoltei]|uniref:Kelch motif family protein n=1 Tax=Blepharisma stoltei TaxID=1481888 RepID=A0AAU9II92_9CILI|nr:unnamed protein product [Blepharisma stoltei]
MNSSRGTQSPINISRSSVAESINSSRSLINSLISQSPPHSRTHQSNSSHIFTIPYTLTKTFTSNSLSPSVLNVNPNNDDLPSIKEEQSIIADQFQRPHHSKRNNQLPQLNSVRSMPNFHTERYEDITIPMRILYGIVEIYGVGFSLSSKTGYGNPLGVGIFITKNLILTANSAIPDEISASRCFYLLTMNKQEKCLFDSRSFFYTNRGLDFTIIGVANNRIENSVIEIRDNFSLKDADNIIYWNAGVVTKLVTGIDDSIFSYMAGGYVAPGMPIFDLNWKLQGIHHASIAAYRFNQGTRIDMIIKTLCSVKNISSNFELNKLLIEYSKKFHMNLNRNKGIFDEGKYMYYFKGGNRNIYRYEIPTQKWSQVKVSNLEQFLTQETLNWKFNLNSRLVYIPDGSIIVIGGIGSDVNSSKADVYHFNTDNNELYRRSSMLERREGPAVIYRQRYVYVVGGKYSYNTCEKFSLDNDSWSYIAPMIYGRFEPTAIIVDSEKYLYVLGGYPLESSGKSVERYYFVEDRWEKLNIALPSPLIHVALFPVSLTKFAILGGLNSRSVRIFEIIKPHLEYEGSSSQDEIFKVYDTDRLPSDIETTFPMVFYKAENKVYFIKSTNEESPEIFSYNYNIFLTGPVNKPLEHRRRTVFPTMRKATQFAVKMK